MVRLPGKTRRYDANPTLGTASDFARYLKGSQSNTLLGIQQSIMLRELAVNRVLDNLVPR